MQLTDKDGNVFGTGGLEITSSDGKPKVPVINTDITIGTTVINGGVSGRLLFDDAGVVGETNGVHWDKVNSRFGIGTTTPLFPLDILGTAKFASATSGIIIRDWTAFNTYRAIYKASETPSDLNYLLAMDQDVLINSRGSGTDIRFNGAIRARFGNAFSLRVIGSGNTTATVGFEAANSSSTPLLQVRDNGVVLIGTTTDAGYKLDVAGDIRTQNAIRILNPAFTNGGSITHSANSTLVVTGGPGGGSENITFGPSNRIFINAGQTWASQTFLIGGASSVGALSNPGIFSAIHLITGTSTAASAIARAQYINTTLTASANNDVLLGLDIAPTYTNGAFTGLSNFGLRISTSTQAGNNGGQIAVRATDGGIGVIGIQGGGWGSLGLWGPTRYTVSATPDIRVRGNDGGIMIENFLLIGATTNAGYKLDVNGTARVSGNITQAGANTAALGYITNGTLGVYSNAPGTGTVGILVGCVSNGGHTAIFTKGNNSGSTALRVTDQNVGASVNHLMVDFVGATGFGIANGTTVVNSSAQVEIQSTTKGFLPPKMSNAQMLAIATPSEGLVVYDLTNRKLCCYDGGTWQNLF